MKNRINLFVLSILGAVFLTGCEDFLNEKSDKKLAIPTTLADYQALLNYGDVSANYCTAGEVSSDDFYVTDANLNSLNYPQNKRLYSWLPEYISMPYSSGYNEWFNCYKIIFVCNTVLDGIEKNGTFGAEANNLKGQALAIRAFRLLDGAQVWAPAYNEQTANTDLGMVVRLNPDMTLPSVRSSVKQTYEQIISDLTAAIPLLPDVQPGPTLPTKAAAYGILARTYLFMGEYEKALLNAREAITRKNNLIDFNGLDPNASMPIPFTKTASEELIFRTIFSSEILRQPMAKISEALYGLYQENDLRKQIYFGKNADKSYYFRATHTNSLSSLPRGITTAELFLIIAESSARLNKMSEAAEALNHLLIKRWKKNTYFPYEFTDKDSALNIILTERRKELVFRGLRWPDLKRLNRDGANITLTRKVDGEMHTLPPNDPRYAIAIPEEVIELSDILPNPR